MQLKLRLFLLVGLLLSGCGPRSTNETATPFVSSTTTPIQKTQTDTPIPTATLMPTPDFSLVGLPAESTGTLVFDFVDQMCEAQWFTEIGELPCPGNETQADRGYVMKLNGDVQGLPSNLNLLLAHPPEANVETISSKYPPFTVKKGDRFQTVLACRSHSFCDVEFSLNYFDDRGQTGLTHWRYIFADSPVVVDYPLDSIAGETVQFKLAVQVRGNRTDANAVWIAPHIYRPSD